MTQETYQFLTKIHGISNDVCRHCYENDIEVYQADWEGCYNCWCIEVEPRISIQEPAE
jgi:hypothetical protein